jgi:Protein of unknown function, DUF417
VRDDRPFWKTRPLAVGLAFLTGTLLLIALSVMVVGPRFGEWLAGKVHLSGLFVLLWPYIHWTIAVGFTILTPEKGEMAYLKSHADGNLEELGAFFIRYALVVVLLWIGALKLTAYEAEGVLNYASQ